MRALVTGGAGFIGSHVVDALVARGDRVTVVDDLSAGQEAHLERALATGNARLERLDIRDGEALTRLAAGAQPEVIFHLAAQADVRVSVADPAFDASVNVVGTVNVLEAARAVGARRVVNSSTGGAIYGDAGTVPTPEDAPTEPRAAYGTSKLAAELYCSWAARLHGLSTVTLRYGNVYGPRQDPGGEAGVIAILCGCALGGTRPTVYGDGRQTRDYVFVDDVVAANLAAADHPQAAGVYNVGTGTEVSVLDLIDALAPNAADRAAFTPVIAPARPGELERSALNVTRLREELGVTAQVALADGLAQTFAALAAARTA